MTQLEAMKERLAKPQAERYDADEIGEDINHTSYAAAELVRELAAMFPFKESYKPLEDLAVRIQHEIVTVGSDAARAHEAHPST